MDLAFAFGKRVTPHGGGILGGIGHMHLAAIPARHRDEAGQL